MHLLSIQGKYAPAFQLKPNDAGKLRYQVENITQKPALIISSRFRTDLLYEDEQNRLEYFLKAWCAILAYPYSNELKLKFFRAGEEDIAVHYFFYRLELLKRMPRWYEAYREELAKVLRMKASHPLSMKLSVTMEEFQKAVQEQKKKKQEEDLINCVKEFMQLNHFISLQRNNN